METSNLLKLKQGAREEFKALRTLNGEEAEAVLKDGSNLSSFLDTLIDRVVEEVQELALQVVGIHMDTDNLGYCDTGADMGYGCRSECVGMAEDRLKEAFKQFRGEGGEVVGCFHLCKSYCRRDGCNCACGEFHCVPSEPCRDPQTECPNHANV